jgi:hypothetical protein
MAGMPEAGRQAAHVFLDALSGGTFTDEGVDSAATDLAVARLNEVGAVRATLEDDDNVRVVISDLVGGVLTARGWPWRPRCSSGGWQVRQRELPLL